MSDDIETTLRRELHEVADGLQVPPMPALPDEPAPARPRWQPLLLAAAAVAAVALTAAFLVNLGDDAVQPAPSPDRGEDTVSTAPSERPHLLDGQLYVDGQQVPGEWAYLTTGDGVWLAYDGQGWAYGRGPEANEILDSSLDFAPAISPNGENLAGIMESSVAGFQTTEGGEAFGAVEVPGGREMTVRAVTDNGWVIAQGEERGVLWQPLIEEACPEGNCTIDLAETAPEVQVLAGTAAGLVVHDGDEESPYLAEVTATGQIERIADLPAHDDLLVSPDGSHAAWTEYGSTLGDVTSVPFLQARRLDRGEPVTDGEPVRVEAPEGWGFGVRSWQWEDGEHLLATLVAEDGSAERMGRCAVASGECVLLDDE